MDQLLKFHAADPRDTFCTYGLAMECIKLGRLQEAHEWLDKTLVIDPDYAYAHYQKARLLIEDGQSEAARQVIHEGIEAASRAKDGHAVSELQALEETI